MKANDKPIEELKLVRVFDPIHIPREYIDQIKHKEFTTDRFYEFMSEICLIENENGFSLNPYNLLFVLVDDNNRSKGVLWMVIDQLANALVINTFSIDKDYWHNGKAVLYLKEKAIEIKEQQNLERIYWITRSPKHSEKFGFKRSKNVLMEFTDGQFSKGSIHGGECETNRHSIPNDKGSEKVTKEYT